MPTYVVEFGGKSYDVDADSPEQAAAAFDAPAPSVMASAGQAMMNNVLAPAYNVVKPVLELIGRPAEGLMGTVAGTLQTGSLVEGVKRGAAAAFEPNLRNSQISEHASKVLDEQGVLQDHPWIKAAVGTAADVVTDPLNLLGGAGFARKGLTTGLKGLGASDNVAKTLTGVTHISEPFQQKVVPAVGGAIKNFVASSPLAKLSPHIELSKLTNAEGVTGSDFRKGADAARRAGGGLAEARVSEIAHTFQLTPQDLDTLSTGIATPSSAVGQAVLADPRLSGAADAFRKLLDDAYTAEVGSGLQGAQKTLDAHPKVVKWLDALDPADKAQLIAALGARGGPTPAVYTGLSPQATQAVAQLPPHLQRLVKVLEKGAQRNGSYFHDIETLALNPTTGAFMVDTKVPNYVTQLRGASPDKTVINIMKPTQTNLKSAKERSFSWDKHLAEGGQTNMGDIVVARLKDSARAMSSKKLLDDYVGSFGSATPQAGYAQLSQEALEGIAPNIRSTLAGVHLPEAIVNDITGVAIRLSDPVQVEGLIRRGMKMFKTMATTLQAPSHQVTNGLGNIMNMYGSGMPATEVLKDYAQAIATLDFKQGAKAAFGDIPGYTADEVLKLAESSGTIGEMSGFASEWARRPQMSPTAKMLTGQKYNPLNPDNPAYQYLRDINQRRIEDPAKLALFRWHLKQGKSPEYASAQVRKVLFDYADLSDVEKTYLREAIPFYTWTRKNVPLQLATLLQRPAKLSNQSRVLELINELAANDDVLDVPELQTPDYLEDGVTVPLLSGKDGAPVKANLRLPMFDLNTLSGDPQKLSFLLAPPIRIALEQALGKEIGGAPLDNTLVPAGLWGRLTGASTVETPAGPLQTATSRYWQKQIPTPFGAFARTVDDGGTAQGMPLAIELGMRLLGITPTELTPTVRARTMDRNKMKLSAEKKRIQQAILLERLKGQE